MREDIYRRWKFQWWEGGRAFRGMDGDITICFWLLCFLLPTPIAFAYPSTNLSTIYLVLAAMELFLPFIVDFSSMHLSGVVSER